MSSIHQLSDDVINKIAAGEVVERPASVIKELIENALDAGARNIEINLKDGGKSLIEVIDDGWGMDDADLALCVLRHATSKIDAVEDLFRISSMGFRGEALAAISAVSRFSIQSRKKNQPKAFVVEKNELDGTFGVVEDGRNAPVHGTTVRVADLFFSVPARKSFLRSTAAEFAACFEIVQSLAIARPDVGWILNHQGKEKFRCSAILDADVGSLRALRQRVSEIMSPGLADPLLELTEQNKYASIDGLISPPGMTQAHSKNILVFLNGRLIRDKNIRFAIQRGYHSHLMRGRYPTVILRITSDPALVDVNVHPAKTEVRFQYSQDVQTLIALAIRERIRHTDWALPVESFTQQGFSRPTENFQMPVFLPRTQVKELMVSEPAHTASLSSRPSISIPRSAVQLPTVWTAQKNESPAHIAWSELQWIGTFASCYLLFESKDQLLVVDQHAFHERIIYERLKSDPARYCHSQLLLMPEEIELTHNEVEILRENAEKLAQMGLKLSFGTENESNVVLEAMPQIIQNRDPKEFLQSVAHVFATHEHGSSSEALDHLTHELRSTTACHAAVRAGENLNAHELKQLLNESSQVDFFHNCPHGRRVFRWWPLRDVAQWFDRT